MSCCGVAAVRRRFSLARRPGGAASRCRAVAFGQLVERGRSGRGVALFGRCAGVGRRGGAAVSRLDVSVRGRPYCFTSFHGAFAHFYQVRRPRCFFTF